MKKDKKIRKILFILLLIWITLVGCSSTPPAENSTHSQYHTEESTKSNPQQFDLDESPIEDFQYRYDPNTQGVMIEKYMGTSIKVRIPDEIDEEPVTAIGESAFENSGIMYVDIPDTVTVIGKAAFGECTGLTSIVMPKSLKELGGDGYQHIDGAFYYCTGLTSIEIPGSVERIGNYSFVGCTELMSVVIKEGVKTIDSYAFEQCSKLETVEIPNSVVEIGEGAFFMCSSLKTIEIPGNISEIRQYTFKDCSSLTEAKISNSLKKIGLFAFDGCTSLTHIDIPDSIEIDDFAFSNCVNLLDKYMSENISGGQTLENISNEDFSYLAGTYLIFSQPPFSEYGETYSSTITLTENGMITGKNMGGRPPISITKSESGALVCVLSEGKESFDEETGILEIIQPKELYVIFPVGVTSGFDDYPDYDYLIGTDTVRIRYMVFDGGVVDIMYTKK